MSPLGRKRRSTILMRRDPRPPPAFAFPPSPSRLHSTGGWRRWRGPLRLPGRTPRRRGTAASPLSVAAEEAKEGEEAAEEEEGAGGKKSRSERWGPLSLLGRKRRSPPPAFVSAHLPTLRQWTGRKGGRRRGRRLLVGSKSSSRLRAPPRRVSRLWPSRSSALLSILMVLPRALAATHRLPPPGAPAEALPEMSTAQAAAIWRSGNRVTPGRQNPTRVSRARPRSFCS